VTATGPEPSSTGVDSRRGGREGLWQAYFASRSLEARTALLLAYRPIVTTEVQSLPGDLRSCWTDDDLEGFGMLGLLDAISRWQSDDSFEDDAVGCVRGAIGCELARLDWLPRRLRSLVASFNASSDHVRSQLGRTPEVPEVLAEVRRDDGPECASTLEALFTAELVHLDEGVVCGIGTDVVELTDDLLDDPCTRAAATAAAPRQQMSRPGSGSATAGFAPTLHLLVGMASHDVAMLLGVSEGCVDGMALVARDVLSEILAAT